MSSMDRAQNAAARARGAEQRAKAAAEQAGFSASEAQRSDIGSMKGMFDAVSRFSRRADADRQVASFACSVACEAASQVFVFGRVQPEAAAAMADMAVAAARAAAAAAGRVEEAARQAEAVRQERMAQARAEYEAARAAGRVA